METVIDAIIDGFSEPYFRPFFETLLPAFHATLCFAIRCYAITPRPARLSQVREDSLIELESTAKKARCFDNTVFAEKKSVKVSSFLCRPCDPPFRSRKT